MTTALPSYTTSRDVTTGTLPRLHRRNNTFPKIIRIRSHHPYWPPHPVWIL